MNDKHFHAESGDTDFAAVELDDDILDSTTDKSFSQGQLVRRRFLHHRGAMISTVLFILVFLLAFTSIGYGPIPGWWKYGYLETLPVENGGRPTLGFFHLGNHPFGQDNVGKDYFALVMRGAQQSIIVAFIVGIVSTLVGTVVGALAGYYRGWIESLLMRLTDLFIIIPMLVLAAVILKYSGQGIMLLSVMLGLLVWTSLARLVRGEVLSLREREFVSAAHAAGASSGRIIFRHILPNCLGTIIVSATLAIASAILLETSLSFLGLGIKAPDTSLGVLISNYQASFATRPWLFFAPAALILAIALTVNFIGDGLRDAFDPRQKRKVS